LTSLGQPIFSQQAMLTTVRVKSGETIVMGGMMQDSVTESRLSVPLISKLPFIGSLFQDVTYNISKTTYLFFVTVRIIEGEAGTEKGEATTVSGRF
jgi:type II secretory pathway component GspD/PulD (secretin)